jgi:hypothetical protein
MIEVLEARIAPSSTFGYIDLDGDSVTLTSTKGQGTDLRDVITLTPGSLFRFEVAKIDLASDAATFAGTSLTMTVTRGSNGDGFANVGAIVATGMDLGSIAIKGDLGQIDVGNPATLDLAFTSLTVKSMGVFGLRTQGGAGDLTSIISGKTGPIVIKGDAIGISLQGMDGSFPSINIGGSLVGSFISSTGGISAFMVKRACVSSPVSAAGAMPSVIFVGSVLYGSLVASSLGKVKIGGVFVSADGDSTGFIRATTGDIGTVTILGDFRGGITGGSSSSVAGAIWAKGNLGNLMIAGDLIGVDDDNSEGKSASIDIEGRIGKITIRGSIISPTKPSTFYTGISIHADKDIGSIVIGRDVIASGFELAFITAGGQVNPTPGKDLAIGNITIGGSVNGLHIGAGILNGSDDPFQAQGNGDAQIGTVKVGGDFLNSNIVAGVRPVAFTVATADDTVYSMGTALTDSMIRRIVIGGYVEGNSIAVNVHFGFAAQKIGSVTIGGAKVALQADALDQFDLGRTPSKFSLREL